MVVWFFYYSIFSGGEVRFWFFIGFFVVEFGVFVECGKSVLSLEKGFVFLGIFVVFAGLGVYLCI